MGRGDDDAATPGAVTMPSASSARAADPVPPATRPGTRAGSGQPVAERVSVAVDSMQATVQDLQQRVTAGLPPLPDDPISDPPSRVSAWNLANALTVFRLLLVPVFLAVLFHGSGHVTGWRIGACLVFALASITDRFDGQLARRRNLITEFGKLADPIADKALVGAALIGLSMLSDLPWWVTVLVLVREVGVTVLRFWVIRHGVLAASRGGKLKTLLQTVAIGLFVLPHWGLLHALAWVVMVAAIVVALVTGLDYVGRAVALRRRSTAARRVAA